FGLGNGYDGVLITAGAAANTVGGNSTRKRNVISANAHGGVEIFGSGTTGNLVQGNYIGTDLNGNGYLSNNGYPSNLISLWHAEGNALDSFGGKNGTLTNGTSFSPGMGGQGF